MDKTILNVEGMSCSHCVNAITKAVGALDGVSNVDIDLNAKKVSVSYDSSNVSLDTIKSTIEDEGYDVI
ncbi:copper chaperone CopZ [Anaerosacchariphilus polymeriproducens]|uniref:Copper chaperone CopZ n=1 Tax=Anaerosacchariphilus polymeriproducens TaxID=1812858 RepID=A0A371AR54_9FIRM|nr:copper chaperone CopZ [Anaerosacchariphilus polymeriproducens]RDU22012.1 copper chaperone [Anaerosacchariphilus polymeriproducens]